MKFYIPDNSEAYHQQIRMDKIRVLFLQSLLLIWLGLDYHLANAQSMSCPLITIDDLGSTTEFSTQGLIARSIVPPGESAPSVPVRIRSFTKVCDAAGDRINTSSFVSVVVEFQCNFQSSNPSLAVCSDSNSTITRQYQFQCIEQNGQPVWDTIVSGSNLFVQTLNPIANLLTPLAVHCRRCIDDQQSSRADPTTHCDPCPSQCDQGQGRCYLGQAADVCCSFYLQNNCTEECPSALVNDSNFVCVCPSLSLANGDVSYSPANRDIGSVATYTCNPGYRLSSPQAGMTRTCSVNGWSSQDFTCERFFQCPDLGDSIENGKVLVTPTARTVNSTAEYSCNDGYKLDKGDVKRICQAGGIWSGEGPQCIPLDKRSNIAAVVGGVAGGLVVLGILSLILGIIVAVKLNKQGNQVKTEAIYNEPDCIQQHKSKKEEAELEECPAYEQTKKDLDLEKCPTYEQAKKELELRECPPYVEKRKDDIN